MTRLESSREKLGKHHVLGDKSYLGVFAQWFHGNKIDEELQDALKSGASCRGNSNSNSCRLQKFQHAFFERRLVARLEQQRA